LGGQHVGQRLARARRERGLPVELAGQEALGGGRQRELVTARARQLRQLLDLGLVPLAVTGGDGGLPEGLE
jgi:hypothetical protein